MRVSLIVVCLFNLLMLFAFSNMSFADITFVDGKWETTFDCEDVIIPNSPSACNELAWGGHWTFFRSSLTDGSSNNWSQSSKANEWYYTGPVFVVDGSPKTISVNKVMQTKKTVGSLSAGEWAWGDNDSLGTSTVYVYQTSDPDSRMVDYIYAFTTHGGYVTGDYVSSITSDANNADGLGGKGFRTMDGDGINIDTGPLQVDFPEPQKELWIRWYQRWEKDYGWDEISVGRFPLYNKNIYLFTGVKSTAAIAEFWQSEYVIVAQNAPVAYPVKTTGDSGWTTVMGGEKADGLYHCYEMYVKMDTDGTNGIGRIWIDGELKASETNVNWSGKVTPEIAKQGWTYFKFGENQAYVDNKGVVKYVDYDDIAVYNSIPPNKDALGNPFIGPIYDPDFKRDN